MDGIKYFFIILLMSFIAVPVQAERFSVVKGVSKSLLFTNRSQKSGSVLRSFSLRSMRRASYTVVGRGVKCPQNKNFDSIIKVISHRYGVDPALVKAVVHAESAFNACARSPRGAAGLMQLMPSTARSLGVSNPYEPAQNLRGGVKYLAQLIERYNGDIRLSLAAYNAGPGAVSKHNGVPPYGETLSYVNRVMSLHRRYRTRLFS